MTSPFEQTIPSGSHLMPASETRTRKAVDRALQNVDPPAAGLATA